MKDNRADISLLFDFFVVSQNVRRLVQEALADAPLRGDEYAVYSLLFERAPLTATEMSRALGLPLSTVLDHLRSMAGRGHLRRRSHPVDGRAMHLSLTISGTAAHRRTNAAWERMCKQLEGSLGMPIRDLRQALQALDDAARRTLAAYEGTVPDARGGVA